MQIDDSKLNYVIFQHNAQGQYCIEYLSSTYNSPSIYGRC